MNIASQQNVIPECGMERDMYSCLAKGRKCGVLIQAAAALCMMGGVALCHGADAPPAQSEPHAASTEPSAAACAAHLPLDHGPHETTTPYLNKKHYEECLAKSAARRPN